jgi:DNA-directed RNA polymerase specialized sigma24 family protein
LINTSILELGRLTAETLSPGKSLEFAIYGARRNPLPWEAGRENETMTPLIQEILKLLPSLRRYARAVTGDRRSADRYIRMALEILAEEPWRVPPGHEVKFGLYKLFDDVLSIFESDPTGETIDQTDPYHRLKHGVLDLPILSRKLLLLVTVERFPLSRAAKLLQMPAREAEIHLAGACARLSGLAPALPDRLIERISEEQAA